jgi:putative heme-binding domain-containing protein
MATAGGAGVGEDRRVAAIRFLSELGFAKARGVLGKALGGGESEAVQLAAVRTLGRLEDLEVGRMLVESSARDTWPQSVRSLAIAVVAERSAWASVLLDALERGALPLWVVEPQRRRGMQAHGDAVVRERARKLFATAGGEDRRRVYEELKPVLTLPAEGARGREVFLRACAACHRHGADGVTVGPDLTGVRNQPAEALLLHIVVPDAEIYPGYQACEVETTDGRSLSGLLVSEGAESVVLRKAGGELETLPRAVVRSLALSRVSLMPQELEKTMSRQELGDLIGFLKGGE